VFGRLLLLAAYGASGARFWVAATKLGFSSSQKRVALAAFFSWIPFQIFAFSYNSASYLLIVALVAEWITRDPLRYRRYAVITAALLTVLTYTHPTAGLALLFAATAEAAWRIGTRPALLLLAATAAFGLSVFGLIMALHGPGFLSDLLDAVNFSRAFGVGGTITTRYHFTGLFIVLVNGAIFIQRVRFGRAFNYPLGAENPLLFSWVILTGLVIGISVLLSFIVNWTNRSLENVRTIKQ